MNNASSRSHCIFTINVEQSSADDVNNVVISKLQLVDLAGSERAGLTGNTGIAYKESVDINKSLLTLRKVINGLSENKSSSKRAHIPYRESKLTCLLKQSLGGNSFCLMIACLPPSDKYLDENISTLTYATKASYIANEPNKNEDPRMKIIHELRKKVTSLEKELKAANDHIIFLTSLTGGQLVKKPGLFDDGRPSDFEQEVKLGENSESERWRDELELRKEISTPIRDDTELRGEEGEEEAKSEMIEESQSNLPLKKIGIA
jgi:hypothetical protein